MDVIGGVIARLDEPAPRWADRLRWHRLRKRDRARRVIDLLVARGDVVVDIGAAHGHFCSRLLDLVGPRGVVHAFEPNPAHQARLRAIARTGPLSLHAVALSDRAGQAVLRIPVLSGAPRIGLASLEPRRGVAVQEVQVPVMRLDDILDDRTRVAFIKCDVEGHEDAVVRGAEALLRRDRPAVLVEVESRHRTTGVPVALERFAALGYEGWAVFPEGLRPVAEFDLERDQLAFLTDSAAELMPARYINDFLFVPPGRDLEPLLDPGRDPRLG